ncbi:MAG TPA: kelch repeat-containing protein [Ktedonobacteraceae bacterium]
MDNALQGHWRQLNPATLPPSWRGSSLVFDKKRQQTVFVAAGETWLWNGESWSKAQSRLAPPARNTTHLVYDALTECVLLFGGIGLDGSPLNDVWLWNGSLWTEQHPAQRPFPLGGAAIACDVARQQVILFGGRPGLAGSTGSNRVGSFSSTTWIWDGATWQAYPTKNTPPGRSGGQLVYDALRQQTLLFGGIGTNGYLNDMWLWQGTRDEANWQQLFPTTLPPTGTRLYATFHEQLQQVLLLTEKIAETNLLQHSFQSWVWDGVSWSQSFIEQILPGSIEGCAYDSSHNTLVACVVTGGKALLANKKMSAVLPDLAVPTLASQTWIW